MSAFWRSFDLSQRLLIIPDLVFDCFSFLLGTIHDDGCAQVPRGCSALGLLWQWLDTVAQLLQWSFQYKRDAAFSWSPGAGHDTRSSGGESRRACCSYWNIELIRLIAQPYCTQILGDLGYVQSVRLALEALLRPMGKTCMR